MFVKTRDSEIRKGLEQKRQQERVWVGLLRLNEKSEKEA